jgi:UDP-N-acetylglucosamine 2-epimerase
MGEYFGSGQILCIVGARPNFMKIAPIMRAFAQPESLLSATLLHTGQHYDAAMKHAFFDQLNIPEPDVDLGVGSGSHAQQTADIMKRFEPVLDASPPRAVLVVGDVNSTIACALVAVKKGIPVIHVEAGLRSGDRGMPEEINRILTDQLSDLLFITEAEAAGNLAREGIAAEKVHFVGNVMIDSLRYNLHKAVPASVTLAKANCGATGNSVAGYGLVTLHRPSNVDDPVTLARLLTGAGKNQSAYATVVPDTPAHGVAYRSRGSGRPVEELCHHHHWTAGLSGNVGIDEGCARRAHRLGWNTRRDNGSGRSLHYSARQHRTPDYCYTGHQYGSGYRCRCDTAVLWGRDANGREGRPHSRSVGW